jgi:hypothetical protein
MYQKYKGRVSFVWVYGSEAHPEEHPFKEDYESKDLGWSHPYSITTTMAERAQRAKWMKTDPEPDYEIPMMIDYINVEGHDDDAIRRAFFGSGFYSGYIIDCDGTVLRRHAWGWYGPDGEWWGLPLAPVQDLEQFLDSYLADPPPCYGAAAADAGARDLEPRPDDRGAEAPDRRSPPAAATGSSSGCAVGGVGRLGAAWWTGLVLTALALAGRRQQPR